MQVPVPQCSCQSTPNFVSYTAAPHSDVHSCACCVFVLLSGAASQPFSGDMHFWSAARLLSRRSLMIGFSLCSGGRSSLCRWLFVHDCHMVQASPLWCYFFPFVMEKHLLAGHLETPRRPCFLRCFHLSVSGAFSLPAVSAFFSG